MPTTHVSVPPRARRPPRLVTLTTLAFALITLSAFREDDLDCEEAVAHLQSCCTGGFNPTTFDCTYTSGCGTTNPPQFTVAQSLCIEALDCADINSSGFCTAGAGPNAASLPDGTPSTVCP